MSLILLNIISFLFPIFGFTIFIIYFATAPKDKCLPSKKISFLFGMMFASFGYSIQVRWETDLTRYFDKVESINLSEGLLKLISNDNNKLFAQDILFYIVKKSGDLHFLPFIVGLFSYWIVYYVVFDMIGKSKHKFTKIEIFELCFIIFAIITPYSVIGNIRCVFAYILISFAIYRELEQNKKNIFTLGLYILPIGLHSSAIIIIALRIGLFGLKKLGKSILVIPFVIPTMIGMLYQIKSILGNGFVGKILYDAINKAYFYLNWNEGGWASEINNSISDKITRIYGAVFLIIVLIVSLISKKDSLLNKTINVYFLTVTMCALGCLTIKTGAFWRFESIVILFSSVIFVPLYERESYVTNIVLKCIFVTSIIMFIANQIMLIRNLNMENTLISTFLMNGFVIIKDILKIIGVSI